MKKPEQAMVRSFLHGVVFSLAVGVVAFLSGQPVYADNADFHDAPESSKQLVNPYEGSADAVKAGKPLYHLRCARCHGERGEGSGNIPALRARIMRRVTSGEIFWFITKGDIKHEMPSWASLPKDQRWKIVTFVKSLNGEAPAAASAAPATASTAKLDAPMPKAPFVDFRTESPGTIRKITVADLPQPFATASAGNGPRMVARPADAWPKAPAGFKVGLYAAGLENPRTLRTAPNGDIFVAETGPGNIRVFRGASSDGKPEEMHLFASGLNEPYGIAFYPNGPDPQWVYVGNTNAVVRFPYHNGDVKASAPPEHIADLPSARGGHTTRSIQFSLDGKRMFVGVGSVSNVDDPDTTPAEKNRATILVFNPDGSDMKIYASGIRNSGGGITVNPTTGELWCSVNERDALGDNLVPDYITHVQEGGFYGWPWYYIGGHQDPRHAGKHPELKDKVIVPDVLLQPHNASLEFLFYDGKQLPAEYQGDIFASEHGSWNKAVRTGYEVIRVPLHQTAHASGEYQDFLTGFVLDNGEVWGRPVGITQAPDGSLLVSDDGSGSIWRVSYTGK
jgi:glucose/arabinose dehydrogenase